MDFNFNQISGKRVLITGGCGFLGSNLARKLIEFGANVTIFKRMGSDEKNIFDIKNKLEIIEGNFTNDTDIIEAIKDKDYIFHFAWQTDLKKSMINPRPDLFVDCSGIINLLEACKNHNKNVKIIFPSTPTVIGMPEKIPSNESASLNPLSVYDIHKLFAEFYFKMYYKQYRIKSTVLRLSNVFGEYQRTDNPSRGVLNFMIGRALRGEILTVYGEGDFIRDYCYIQNYVDAFIFAAISENTNGQVYLLGTGQGRTFNEIVEKIKLIVEGLINKPVVIKHIPHPEGEHEINKRDFIADYSKFREATGWYPQISFDEGLKKTINFYINKN